VAHSQQRLSSKGRSVSLYRHGDWNAVPQITVECSRRNGSCLIMQRKETGHWLRNSITLQMKNRHTSTTGLIARYGIDQARVLVAAPALLTMSNKGAQTVF